MAGSLLPRHGSFGAFGGLLPTQQVVRQDEEGRLPVADITFFLRKRNSAARGQGGEDKRDGGISNSQDGVEEETTHHLGRNGGRERCSDQGPGGEKSLGLKKAAGVKSAIEVSDEEEVEELDRKEGWNYRLEGEDGEEEEAVGEVGFPPSPPRFWTPLANFICEAGRKKRKWGGLLGQSSPIRKLFNPTFHKGGWAKEDWPDLPGREDGFKWKLPEALKLEVKPTKEAGEGQVVKRGTVKVLQPLVWNKKKRKHMMEAAIVKAKELGKDTRSVSEFKKKFSANSSRKPQLARRKTIEGIAKSLGKETNLGKAWNPESFTKLGAVLKDSGYKSAKIYLAEAKMMHVEAGGVWDQQMVRVHQQVKRAVERGKGKTKKAAEVPAHLWITDPPEKKPEGNSSKRVSARRANLAFALGVHWMLREAELVELVPEDITLDMGKKLAKLTLRSSKTDQAGETVSRILQCSCGEVCSSNKQCPYFVAWEMRENGGAQTCENQKMVGGQSVWEEDLQGGANQKVAETLWRGCLRTFGQKKWCPEIY